MTRRKGELNSKRIDDGWPYQVALAERLTTGKSSMKCSRPAKTYRSAAVVTASSVTANTLSVGALLKRNMR